MQGARIVAGIDQAALTLGPIPHGEIAHIISEPAAILRRKAGPAAPLFDAAVIERLQHEIEGEDDALPLLAFVLQRLMHEHQGMATIGLSELDRTGGVAAAIEAAADAALDDAGIGRDRTTQRDTLRRLFIPRLTRIDPESKAAQRRVARRNELPADLLLLARALTQRRLLVARSSAQVGAQTQGGTAVDAATLEVAHEALLRRWPTLSYLLADDRDALLLLSTACSPPPLNGKRPKRGTSPTFWPIADRGCWTRRHSPRVGPTGEREIALARAYLAACAEREAAERAAQEAAVARTQKLQRRTIWALVAILIVVMAALGGALWNSYQTSKREAVIFASAAETAFQETGICDRALRMAVAGLPPGEGASPLSYRSHELQDDLAAFVSSNDCYFQLALARHGGPVNSAAFSSDGSRVVTASDDKIARVWDAKTGAVLATLSGHTDRVISAAFSPDGSRIVTASQDGTARLWDATNGARTGRHARQGIRVV